MFRCERCGSRYSAVHAAAMESCPRCQIRDQVTVPLYFKPFRLSQRGEERPPERAGREEEADSSSAWLPV